MVNDKIEWTEINVYELSCALAKEDWMKETKNTNADLLYDMVALPNGDFSKEINSHWASLYWSLQQQYMQFIMEYTKK